MSNIAMMCICGRWTFERKYQLTLDI